MNKIIPTVPSGCKLVGFLYESNDPRDRGEDMLDISLPNGLLISAGWFPEGSETGRYMVTMSIGLEFITQPFQTDDPYEARDFIQYILDQCFTQGVIPISNTESSYSDSKMLVMC